MTDRTERPRRVGIEHEYRVSRNGDQVDFRSLIHDLGIVGKPIDPGDRFAYRLPTGLKLTCDGREAEIATPPIDLASGCIDELLAWAAAGGESLRNLLGDGYLIEGVSTHISVAVNDELGPRAAGLFARTFAPALMLMMDADVSPGLLIRPRFHRLEFGGEFVKGDQLAAGIAIAAGATIVCESAAASFLRKSRLPPAIRVDVVRAVDRYGWYVGREAFGIDLYRLGRQSRLRRELFGTIQAQSCLEKSWAAARTALTGILSANDLRAADDAISGVAEIPLESGIDVAPPHCSLVPTPTDLGAAIQGMISPEYEFEAVVATWDFVVFRAHGDNEVFVTVPTTDLNRFLEQAISGRYDAHLDTFALEPHAERTMASFDEALQFGLWDAVQFSPRLAAPERGPHGVARLAGL